MAVSINTPAKDIIPVAITAGTKSSCFVLSFTSPLKNFVKKESDFYYKNRNRLSLDTPKRVICTIYLLHLF